MQVLRSIVGSVKLPNRTELRQGIEFILINFATPIAFYFTFRWRGAKPAIALAIVVTLIQLMTHGYYRIKPSPFFIIASGFTVFFGGIDLFIHTPQFFRLEPSAQNLIVGSGLFFAYFARYPIAKRFLDALPQKIRPIYIPDAEAYLRRLTLVWAFYLYFKAAFFSIWPLKST